jgi:RNA polymerase sigma factor (sigma-70 family)
VTFFDGTARACPLLILTQLADGSNAPLALTTFGIAEVGVLRLVPGPSEAPAARSEAGNPELTDAALHERYARRIDRIVGALIGQDSEREDLVHEALIRVFEQVGCVRDPSRLDQWVYRVTLNTVWGAIRRRRRGRLVPLDVMQPRDEPAHHVDVETRELAQRTARIIDRLPHADRALLLRHWFEPGSPRDIAKGFGCAPITVKRKLKRARERFQRLLNADRAFPRVVPVGE